MFFIRSFCNWPVFFFDVVALKSLPGQLSLGKVDEGVSHWFQVVASGPGLVTNLILFSKLQGLNEARLRAFEVRVSAHQAFKSSRTTDERNKREQYLAKWWASLIYLQKQTERNWASGQTWTETFPGENGRSCNEPSPSLFWGLWRVSGRRFLYL